MSETIKTVRVTKAQKWGAVLTVLEAMQNDMDYEPIHIAGTDKAAGVVLDIPTLMTFAREEMEALAKKNKGDKGMTDTQKQNEVYKGMIYDYLVEHPGGMTCFGFTKEIPEFAGFSTSKVSSLLRGMGQNADAAKGKYAFTVDSKTEHGQKIFYLVKEIEDVEEEGE